jgi:ISXO2-like transposase domain
MPTQFTAACGNDSIPTTIAYDIGKIFNTDSRNKCRWSQRCVAPLNPYTVNPESNPRQKRQNQLVCSGRRSVNGAYGGDAPVLSGRGGGEGKSAEIDGGYFGGYVKPASKRENRRDRRLRENRSGKRKVVVVMRERGGETLPAHSAAKRRR